jgi:hypothetical protein
MRAVQIFPGGLSFPKRTTRKKGSFEEVSVNRKRRT